MKATKRAEKRYTTKQVAEYYRQEAARSESPLWRGAAADVHRICSKYPRKRAGEMLMRLGEETKEMAISCTFIGAANMLKD